MHRSAVLDLKRICDDLEFMSFERIVSPNRRAEVEKFHNLYSQVQQGCKSIAPLRISQAFTAIDTRLLLRMPSNKAAAYEGSISFMTIFLVVWNELYCAISAYWLWPFAVPDPHRTMEAVLDGLHDRLARDLHLRSAGVESADGSRPNIGSMLLQRQQLPLPVGGAAPPRGAAVESESRDAHGGPQANKRDDPA
jgi:hypothetical protein